MRGGDAQLAVASDGSMNKKDSLDPWWVQAIYFGLVSYVFLCQSSQGWCKCALHERPRVKQFDLLSASYLHESSSPFFLFLAVLVVFGLCARRLQFAG